MSNFHNFQRIFYENGMFNVLECTTTTWLSDIPRLFSFRFSSCFFPLIQYKSTIVDYKTIYAMYSSFRFLRVSKGVFDAMKKLIFQSIQF